MTTKHDLQTLVRNKLSDYQFIVVSNRQPYIFNYQKGEINCTRGAGGVITALDPVVEAVNGIWVSNSSGEADLEIADKKNMVKVPHDNHSYTLKFVKLTKEENEGYYYGFSNESLWPMCHMVFQRPFFREDDWENYCKVNKKFAKAILSEIGKRKAFIFIQDYHLTLLPKYIRELTSTPHIIAHFWHIPWPNYEALRICPQRKEILQGMLSNDLLGFHIRYHCNNFLDAVDREIECKINREQISITKRRHETLVRDYPISVDFDGISNLAKSEEVIKITEELKNEYSLHNKKVLLGLDRIDYTKGILERLRAYNYLLEKHPELEKKVVFLQMGQLTRIHLSAYKMLNDEINKLVEEINWKFSTASWKPVIMVRKHLPFKKVLAFYNLGDLCIVSSLHDGMNLVAKEYISSRYDKKGMLVLSRFTGAARELKDAILANPYDTRNFSEAIYKALTLEEKERKRKMTKLRRIVQQNNIYLWACKIINELLKYEG